jgi:hypothetical protein
MKKYVVQIPEVWMRYEEVEADSRIDAIERVSEIMRSQRVNTDIEFSHTMGSDRWDVDEIED